MRNHEDGMKIIGVEEILYGVDDPAVGQRYFDDWGVAAVERSASGADFRLPSGQLIRVRNASDPTLPSAEEGPVTAREVIWGVDSKASLEALGADLSRDRKVDVDAAGTLHTRDPMGFAIGFRVATSKNPPAAAPASRRNNPFAPRERAQPTRVGHVVYNVSADKAAEGSAFYQDRLKFRLSDKSKGFGEFLRCSGSTEHHNLFLLQLGKSAFNHAAFEVSGFDEIIAGGKHMASKGWKEDTRPGRHILGSNLFWYFKNPCGGKTEYYADMDVMDDEWKPRIWDKHPGFAHWMMD
jgi:catechol 2,3-dioxygenase-like lactoylglutathione lyase family enzyme